MQVSRLAMSACPRWFEGLFGKPAVNLEKQLSRYSVGEKVEAFVFRRDELMKFDVILADEHIPKFILTLSKDETPSMKESRQLWLQKTE